MKKIFLLISAFLFALPLGSLASTYSSSDVPLVFSRSTWETEADLLYILDWVPEEKNDDTLEGQNPNSNETIPDYSQVERIVIHDTGCCNKAYEDSRQVIQSIYKNHAVLRGWGDIGYHYIIDKLGNIYETRFGGNGVRGAHVYDSKECRNFNVGTIGISILGDYQNIPIPEPAFEALTELVAWLSATNSIEPTQMQKTSSVWTNLKIDGKCNSEYGAFSKTFTGPVVLGHNNIEPANSDPGTLNMTKLRTEAQNLKNKYSKYIYETEGQFFTIKNGLKNFVSPTSSAIKISATQAGLFPDASKIDLPEGTLIRSRGRPEIFVIEDKKRKHVSSYAIFAQRGYSLSDVKTLGDRELINYTLGDPLLYADGTVLESEETKKTYLVENQEKRYITSAKAAQTNNINLKNTIKISERELEYYKDGGIVALPEGSVITDYKRHNFYVVADGGKKRVYNWSIFLANKLHKKPENKLTQKELDLYPDKGYVLYPEGTLVKEENQPKIYVVKKSVLEWIPTYEEFQRLKYQMKDVVALKSQDFREYALGSTAVAAVIPVQVKNVEKSEVVTAEDTPAETTTNTNEQTIRIALSEVGKSEEIKIKANGDFSTINKSGEKRRYSAQDTLSVTWSVFGDLRVEPTNKSTIFEILTYEDYNWNNTTNFNKFRGTLKVAYSSNSNKVWLVNELPFEDYLLGVAEAVNSDPKEYQKAFAISARSYAMFHLEKGGKRGTNEIFHLNNTSSDQVYRGYGWELYSPNLPIAVKETRDEVIKYNGKTARAVYSSDSGGVTKNACSLWRGVFCTADYGYLEGGVYDPAGTQRRDAAQIAKSHGVGMSAAGGRRLAELGKNYQEILKYYYKNIEIVKLN